MKSTAIARSMEAFGDSPHYDAASKKLMSFKDVVAWILKLNTKEFADYDVSFIASNCISEVSVSEEAVHQDEPDRSETLSGNERVTLLNSESKSTTEGTVYYDIRLRANIPGEKSDVFLFINIEIQNEDKEKYSLVTRGLYYCARMISEQYGTVFTKSDYQKIQKVYSIWISQKIEEKREKSSITRFSLSKEDVLGNSFINEADYDKMEVVVIKLGKDSEYSEDSITGLPSALLSPTMPLERRMEILSGIYRIAMTEEIEREVTKVCSLGDAIKEEGIIEGQVKSLTKFIDNGRITVDEAATSVNMTVEDFLKKREEIEKKSSF